MNTLRSVYQDWHDAYTTLDFIIRTFETKMSRDEQICKNRGYSQLQTITYLLEKEQEEAYDTFAYNDSIALRFNIFSKLSLKLLKAYFQELYDIKAQSKNQIFELCSKYNLLSFKDLKSFVQLDLISNPLEHNQRLYIELASVISKLILGLSIDDKQTHNTRKLAINKLQSGNALESSTERIRS